LPKLGAIRHFQHFSDSVHFVAAENQDSREMAIAQSLSKRQDDQIGHKLPQLVKRGAQISSQIAPSFVTVILFQIVKPPPQTSK